MTTHSASGLCEITFSNFGHFASLVKVVSAVARDENTIRVTFDRGMWNNNELIDPDNYTVAPNAATGAPVNVVSIISKNVTNPVYVDVITSEMTDGETYLLTVSNSGPTDIESIPVDPVNDDDTLTGIGVAPLINSIEAIDKNKVKVIFNEIMLDNPTIRDASNYSFDGGLTVSSILSVEGAVVMLVTSDQIPGTLYTLTINQP